MVMFGLSLCEPILQAAMAKEEEQCSCCEWSSDIDWAVACCATETFFSPFREFCNFADEERLGYRPARGSYLAQHIISFYYIVDMNVWVRKKASGFCSIKNISRICVGYIL